ncbi:energy transducer TonB [uncultured Winogradskyella sp.]|uniref:energy transducer TonB n=1 Tax=uncultured Winogradskyella sp. TaxID=395353 RepID=UPI002607BE1E|nr:energy transducer TonB [uncultured Winogradskyella sp.]
MKNFFLVTIFLLSFQLFFAQSRPDDGPFKDYHDTGELMLEGQYKNGKRVGEWKGYNKKGQVVNISSFTNGKKNIPEISFFDNGTVKRKTEREGDIYIVRAYYESGKLFYERAYMSGYYKQYTEEGKLKIEANYKDFQLYGKWKSYNEDENLDWSISYENGYRNGVYQNYYNNGQLKVQGVILNDRKNGEEKRYDESGNLVWKGYYQNDEFVKTWIKYNEKGKKIKKVNTKKEKLEILPTKVVDGVIEKVPVFPGCEEVFGNRSRKKCMSQRVAEHIISNFDKRKIANLGLSPGRKRIFVKFKVDKSGKLKAIQARGPHPAIEREAIRIIKLLPNLEPGTQRGKPVTVPYSLPIVFVVE